MSDTTSSTSEGFESFDLNPKIMRGLSAASFTSPRPIQAETIPAALEGRDILGLAPTGTGKTAAFALPILDVLLEDPVSGPTALIIAPTRELASQIDAEIRVLANPESLELEAFCDSGRCATRPRTAPHPASRSAQLLAPQDGRGKRDS